MTARYERSGRVAVSVDNPPVNGLGHLTRARR